MQATDGVPSRRVALGAVCLATALLFVPLFHIIMPRQYDYYWHIDTALLLLHGRLIVPHPLLAILIAALHAVGLNEWTAVLCVVSGACVVSAAAIFVALDHLVDESSTVLCFLSVSLLLVNAPALFALKDHHLYFGYIAPNTFHNPTVIVLKPFAILLHLTVVRALTGRMAPAWRIALLAVLSALAKPSYLICLLPGVIAYWVIHRPSRDALRRILAGLFAPSILILALQYYFAYVLGQPHPARIVWAPLVVMHHWSGYLLPKFALSILFPLAAWCIAPSRAAHDQRLTFAWLVFLFSGAYAYGFAETGERMFHGNLWWSAQVALLLLFFESARFCLEHARELSHQRQLMWVGCYGLHLSAGVLWYSRNVTLHFNF